MKSSILCGAPILLHLHLQTFSNLLGVSGFVAPYREAVSEVKQLFSQEDENLQTFLKRAEDRDFKNFVKDRVPKWLPNQDSLPFDCTSCGKCCQTVGSVWMSPQEIEATSASLRLDRNNFVSLYASHIIEDGEQSWIRLKDIEGSCIFLLPDSKCRIYETRPVHCRTYPFWTNILESPATWNRECRSADDDEYSSLPRWTPGSGGCEGMKTIESKDCNTPVVSLRDVERNLFDYDVSRRHFPANREQHPVE